MSTSPASSWRNATSSAPRWKSAKPNCSNSARSYSANWTSRLRHRQTHENAVTELRTAFDQDRLALMAAADVSAKEVDQQRRVFERERAELAAELKRREDEVSELRLAFDREREELQSRLQVA